MISVLSSTLLFSRQFLCNFPPSSTGTSLQFIMFLCCSSLHIFPGYFYIRISGYFFFAIFHQVHQTLVCRLYDFCIVLHSSLFQAVSVSRFSGTLFAFSTKFTWHLFAGYMISVLSSALHFFQEISVSRFPGILFSIFHQVHQALVCRLYGFCIAPNYSLFQAIYLQFPTAFNRTSLQSIMSLCCSPFRMSQANSMSGVSRHFLCDLPSSSPGTCLQIIWFLYCPPLIFSRQFLCYDRHSILFQAISVLRFPSPLFAIHHVFSVYNVSLFYFNLHFIRQFLCQVPAKDISSISLSAILSYFTHPWRELQFIPIQLANSFLFTPGCS